MTTTPEVSAADRDTGIHARIDKAVLDATADLLRWRRHLHEHPELSNREAQTAAHLIEQLRDFTLDPVQPRPTVPQKRKTMHTLMVLYGPPTDPEAFRTYYQNTHLPIARKLPGVRAIRHSGRLDPGSGYRTIPSP